MRILSIDIGTSSCKAALLDGRCAILKTAKSAYRFAYKNDNWVELDGAQILQALVETAKTLTGGTGEAGGAVDLIVFDTFSPSMMFMDAEGEALYPIVTHLDRRSAEQSRRILDVIGKERFLSITGIQPFIGGASITSALWMKQNMPEVYGKAARIGHLSTFVYKQLTGLWATDPVNASQSGMYATIAGDGWSREVCGAVGIDTALLPDVRAPGESGGALNKRYAELLGLKEGTPVAVGTNDAAAAQVGAGNGSPGDILIISGSSEMVSILADKPVADERYYLRCSCTPGLWQVYATTAGGFAIDWCKEQFYKDMGDAEFYAGELARAADLYGGVGVRFEPYLSGDRQSLEPKTASLSGLTLNTTRREILASVLVGMHRPIQDAIEASRAFVALGDTIKVTGGLVDSPVMELKRKLFPGFALEAKEDCPLIGNAILGMKGLSQKGGFAR